MKRSVKGYKRDIHTLPGITKVLSKPDSCVAGTLGAFSTPSIPVPTSVAAGIGNSRRYTAITATTIVTGIAQSQLVISLTRDGPHCTTCR